MYDIELKPSAQKFIEGEPKAIQKKLMKQIAGLADNTHPKNSKQLDAKRKVYRFKYQKYRILYQIQKKKLLILVAKVGFRKDIYKNLGKRLKAFFVKRQKPQRLQVLPGSVVGNIIVAIIALLIF